LPNAKPDFLVLTDQDLNDLDTSLSTMRHVMSRFVVLQPEDRIEVKKMGPKSRQFCEQALGARQQPSDRSAQPGAGRALADKPAPISCVRTSSSCGS
jgi:hypothetical protein